MNRSFWTAATSSGLVVNSPMRKWFTANDAETIFERLEARGKTWKVYVMEPMALSFTGLIHFPRLKDRLATHFVPFAEFEKDAVAGTLPDFSLLLTRSRLQFNSGARGRMLRSCRVARPRSGARKRWPE